MFSHTPTISEIHDLYKSGKTVSDVINQVFETIKIKDKAIQAFVRTYQERALAQAIELDTMKDIQSLDKLLEIYPLYGIPYCLKDNILVEGLPVTAQSKVLEGYIAPYSSDIYTSLTKAGAVLVGHGNMDEFAMGSSTEYSGYGQITHNPHDLTRVAGGTSGGPAAAVAGGMVVFSIGTDTGGSVRQPASFCGIVGLRPSWGLLSRYGIVSTSSSFDQPGIFAQNLIDTEVILTAVCVPTQKDSTNRKVTYSPTSPKKKYTIGIPKEFYKGLDAQVDQVFKKLHKHLSESYELVPVSLPTSNFNLAAYYLLTTVEAASNFERYDGIRYGKQAQITPYYEVRKEGFGKEVQRRIMLGTFASSAGYIDQFYGKAQLVRDQITQEFETVLKTVDCILTPVSPFPAFKIGEKLGNNPIELWLADLLTLSPALAGNVSISVPFATVIVDGVELPVGAQFISNPETENQLLSMLSVTQLNYDL
jgi:aspartyl-tRNA(Asn)/glutamyl-tRNA(Gln) amidotransferase subunit A